jgi:Cu+-exporting ATPase
VAEQFQAITGKGVTGKVDGRDVVLGNRALLTTEGIDMDNLQSRADALSAEGRTVMLLAVDGRAAGAVAVADPVKPAARQAVAHLKSDGIRVVMATGDNPRTAAAVAAAVDISEFHAEALPEDKQALVIRLRDEGHRVAMAGDGINDAPALAAADVGIAMGTGADVALESAGITLLKGDLEGIARARRLARGTLRNIRQNLFFAFVYNTAGVPIAAGILYPITGALLSPMLAALAMSLSSVSVIANALRLRRIAL